MVQARILVIKLSALGDMVLACPALARIRAAHAGAHVTLLTTPPFDAFARASPYVDAVETDGRPAGARGWIALIRRLRRARYSRIYDLQTNDRTNLIFQALRPRPPVWSGTATGCALPHRNPARMRMHSLERHAQQLEDAGIWPGAPTRPETAPAPDLSWAVPAKPAPQTSPFVLLVPGSSPHRPRKRWPAARYGALARGLQDAGFEVRILGDGAEQGLARTIMDLAPGARELTGQTSLLDMAALARQARAAVGNDTGPMHLIAAVGAPCVVLFSADSDPALSAPRGRVRTLSADDLATLDVAPVLQAALSAAGAPSFGAAP